MLSQSLFCAGLFENVYNVEKLKSVAVFELEFEKRAKYVWMAVKIYILNGRLLRQHSRLTAVYHL